MATVGFADLRRGFQCHGNHVALKNASLFEMFLPVKQPPLLIPDFPLFKPRFIDHLNRKFSRRKSNLTALLRYPTVNFKNVPCSNDGYGQNMGCTSGVSLKDTGAQSKQGRDDASQ